MIPARVLSRGDGAWLTRPEMERVVGGAAARLPDGAPAPVSTGDPVATLVHLLAARERGVTPVVTWPGVQAAALARLVAAVGHAAARLASEPGELLALSTSGSTAAPRTVLRSVASWESSLGPFTRVTGTGPDDVAWAPGPPSSTLTLWALWHALATGVPVVAGGPWHGVPAWPVLDEVTVLHAVPAVLADVLDGRAAGRLPALRAAVVGGAAPPPALRERCLDLGVRLVEYYGAAELSFVAADRDGGGLRPFPGAEVRVRDGVVEVRSPYVSYGYVASSGPFGVDEDGWAGVGDRGVLTAGGVLELAGRGDDALSVGGSVVLLGDVERVLGGVEGVLEAVCWGEPDARLGQRARAALRTDRPAGQRAALVAQVRRAARRELPPAARPLRYTVVDELPRTAAGKPDRRATAVLAEPPPTSPAPRSQR